MGDVLFSSTRWLQQDNLQEMGGPGRIKLARHASHGWKKEIGRVSLRNPEVFYVSGDSPQKDSLCREKKTSSVSDTLSVPTYDTTHLSEPPQSSSLKAQTQGRGMRPLGCGSRTRAPSHGHPAGRDSMWEHPARCQPRHSTPSTPPTRGRCRSPC